MDEILSHNFLVFFLKPQHHLSLYFWFSSEQKHKTKKNCCTLNWCLVNVQSMNTHNVVLNIAVFLCFFVLGWHVRFQLVRHSIRRYLASFHWILWSSGHWLGSWWVHRLNWSVWQMTIGKRLRNLERFSHHCMFFWLISVGGWPRTKSGKIQQLV